MVHPVQLDWLRSTLVVQLARYGETFQLVQGPGPSAPESHRGHHHCLSMPCHAWCQPHIGVMSPCHAGVMSLCHAPHLFLQLFEVTVVLYDHISSSLLHTQGQLCIDARLCIGSCAAISLHQPLELQASTWQHVERQQLHHSNSPGTLCN